MARVDDYANAFKIAAEELKNKNPEETARSSGAVSDPATNRLKMDYIGRPIAVVLGEIRVAYLDGADGIPLTEQVLNLHYLNKSDGTPLSGEFITFREIPSGEFYFSAFVKRAEAPMLKTFGMNPGRLLETAPLLGGAPLEGTGDAAARFWAFPRVPISLVVWGGDDEFEPSGKILFDRSISHYLSTEDVAWTASMIVYRLMRLAAR